MDPIIRLSEQRDLQGLVDLNNTVWNDKNAPASLHWESPEEYAGYNPPGSQLVCVLGDALCGYVSLKQPLKTPSNAHVVELVIAVNDRFRGLGIGRRLLDFAYEWGKANGKKKLSLRVMSTNEPAVSFYTKCGFGVQGKLVGEFFINGQYVDDILMYRMIE
ncbi:GNAT family N-acetyltransferase [Paenibacillus nanensis]|uniref:GNAT family N-acetyltransferase n=1 Tax=Paenibacillus nanensis TaxID=393251 RepID=A0A3A1VHR1_9BACL|nr:GNAT family N-acetyltransferase [Paenibacillus nanensis]RIX60469.1 GNAT family N-acetyltransferase [Paenibacillus nanensis]